MTQYSVAHLDGPHSAKCLRGQIDFFHPRMAEGAILIFDDVNLYNHQAIHEYMESLGWKCSVKGERKCSYTKFAQS